MYSPDEQGEYMPLDGALRFSVQGLSDALADVGKGIIEPPVEEYAMMLEVTMADCPGWPCPPMFSWNWVVQCPSNFSAPYAKYVG